MESASQLAYSEASKGWDLNIAYTGLLRFSFIFFFLEITFTTGYSSIRSNSKTSPEFHLYPFIFPHCVAVTISFWFNHLNHTIITYPDTVLFCFVLVCFSSGRRT